MNKVKVAVVQASPVLFDLNGTIQKMQQLTEEAAASKPDLILFPEAYIPAYPRGLSFSTVVGSRGEEGREMWLKYWDNCPKVPGPEMDQIGKMAKKAKAYIVVGVVERGDSGTLYCSMVYFSPEGKLIGKHRKLKPTAAERIVWGEGNGDDIVVHNTSFGNIGGLICWENYMPLARTSLYEQGVDFYLAPTADHRDSWQATMQHIACEGRCFVLGCNQYVTKNDYPKDLPGEEISTFPEIMTRGGSVIVDPLGNIVAGPLWDEEGILHAELDRTIIAKGKMDFDAVGHYDRPDVFQLTKVNKNSR